MYCGYMCWHIGRKYSSQSKVKVDDLSDSILNEKISMRGFSSRNPPNKKVFVQFGIKFYLRKLRH